MPGNPSSLDYFSKKDPQKTYAFWKRHKIQNFLLEVIDSEYSENLKLVINWKRSKDTKESFIKSWIRQEQFLILFAFLKMLNEHPKKMEEFFLEFLNGFFLSERQKSQKIAEKTYICLNNSLLAFLNASELYSQRKKNFLSKSLEEKRNPFEFAFEESNEMQENINQLHKGFIELGKSSPYYQYASQTVMSLMRRGVVKEGSLSKKGLFAHLFAGFCIGLALAALVYLTIQTAGLIHLGWIIPTAILASTAGGSALLGGLTLVGSTPSVFNRACSFFKKSSASKEPLRLFEAAYPEGMII